MPKARALLALLLLAASPSIAQAIEYHIVDVASLAAANSEPNAIAFADQSGGAGETGQLIPFEEWARSKPVQKRFLALYPDYVEPTVNATVDGVTKPVQEKLYMYVAQARFAVAKPAQSLNLARYASMDFMQRLDPAITHVALAPADIKDGANHNPQRPWCEAKPDTLCVQSKYELEGKLPLGIRLVNQLSDRKKIAEYLEFQSELRVLSPADLDQAGLASLTGVDGPVAGAIAQNIFHVNQVMQFGKLLIVFQQDKADANRTIATAFVAIGIKSNVIENRKKYESVPVLRNLVPAQVLVGKSSFNTGNSISSGLPNYARNEVKAVAAILAKE
jgi:hypothetical protein